MRVNYSGVGGIGIKVDDEIISKLIVNKKFTKEDWEDDPENCLNGLGISYKVAGGIYSNEDEEYYYLLVPGNNLNDINSNIGEFITKLESMGIDITSSDLLVISDCRIH